MPNEKDFIFTVEIFQLELTMQFLLIETEKEIKNENIGIELWKFID